MGTHWSARYLGETGPQERHSRVRGVFITAPAGQIDDDGGGDGGDVINDAG